MYRILASILFVFMLFGCASKSEIQKSTRVYNNVDKDQLLHAAKKLFILSDKEDYIINSYRDDLNVTKPIAKYKLFTVSLVEDHFDLTTKTEDNNSLLAQISISRTFDVEQEDREYVDKDDDLYTLFWDRIDYFLGKNENWSSCSIYRLQANFDGFLCDIINLKNNYAKNIDKIDMNKSSSDHNISKNIKKIVPYIHSSPTMDTKDEEEITDQNISLKEFVSNNFFNKDINISTSKDFNTTEQNSTFDLKLENSLESSNIDESEDIVPNKVQKLIIDDQSNQKGHLNDQFIQIEGINL